MTQRSIDVAGTGSSTGREDHDRASGALQDSAGGRTQQHVVEAAASAGADHHQLRGLCVIEECSRRTIPNDGTPNPDRRVVCAQRTEFVVEPARRNPGAQVPPGDQVVPG